jgi:drug/metabolite transporter (DMT)-like permease
LVAVFFLLPIIWITFLTFSYAAACGLCVLESTAGGLDRIEGWPEPNWKEWMAHLMYVGWIGAIPMGVSYGLGVLANLQGIPLVLSMPVAFFVIYPISLMSALEANSIWVPLTKSILGSLVKWWWCWLMFYLLSGLIAWGLVAAAVFAVNSSNDIVLVALGPLLAAVVLIYSRLLGRLGWRMTTIDCSHSRSAR